MVNRIEEFEIATRDVGRGWRRVDLYGSFADWMDTFDPEERDSCLADPAITKSVRGFAVPGLRERQNRGRSLGLWRQAR